TDDVLLFRLAHAVPEQRGLGKVVAEGFAAVADLVPLDALGITLEATILSRRRGLLGPTVINGIRLVIGAALVDRLPVKCIALVVVRGADRPVDRYLV